MFVSKQVIEKLEGEQTRLRRDVKYLRNAAERGDTKRCACTQKTWLHASKTTLRWWMR
jgi:hypothetical protein